MYLQYASGSNLGITTTGMPSNKQYCKIFVAPETSVKMCLFYKEKYALTVNMEKGKNTQCYILPLFYWEQWSDHVYN